MDASEIYSKRLNATTENGKFILPVADGRMKFAREDQELRTSTLIRQRPIRGESHLDFLGESGGLFHHLTTRFRMPVKRLMTFGPRQETSYAAIKLNPESNFTRRGKSHSLCH